MKARPRPGLDVPDASLDDIARAVRGARSALAQVDDPDPRVRAARVEAIADAIEQDGDDIVASTDAETALGLPRLRGELARTVMQLRFYAAAARHGDDVDLAIVDADGTVPDLVRTTVALGPVAVFGAGNFPLAFGALGTDTAAALAAGCPVVIKGHPSHPRTSTLLVAAAHRALRVHGLPTTALTLVHGGNDVGRALVLDEGTAAVAFTGSLAGGTALMGAAASRKEPIPIFAEMGSVNPVVVTENAMSTRGDEVAAALAASVSGSAGQLCTKPGVLFVPAGQAGDALVATLATALGRSGPFTLLDDRIAVRWRTRIEELTGHASLRQVVTPTFGERVTPALLEATIPTGEEQALGEYVAEEAFGPSAVVLRYTNLDAVRAVLRSMGGQLTLTVQGEPSDLPDLESLFDDAVRLAGRLVWNGVPTGVAVVDAMHHGGPWPASSTALGSVGTEALRRFRRPVSWQGFPPGSLRRYVPSLTNHEVARRRNGRWEYLAGPKEG